MIAGGGICDNNWANWLGSCLFIIVSLSKNNSCDSSMFRESLFGIRFKMDCKLNAQSVDDGNLNLIVLENATDAISDLINTNWWLNDTAMGAAESINTLLKLC